jgi:PhoPQ-activated pathogenicity-related protein
MLLFPAAQRPAVSPTQALDDFLSARDITFQYQGEPLGEGRTKIVMQSQIWQGQPWRHEILLQMPKNAVSGDTAILLITGDGPRAGDQVDLAMLSAATGMPVAMLFNIPNQPLYGMKEDDLIAHTFEKFLETKDTKWPLLFPMTKAAIRAMDAVQGIGKAQRTPMERFIVTGASKRGWTTWLSAASRDRRIAGIAPMVFDNLNFNSQMRSQLDQWGAYSLQIQDYTRRGLQAKMETPAGRQLVGMVDPYSYRDRFRMPVLIVNGGNDPYWTVDATSRYWNDLRTKKNLLMVPNVGHNLGNRVQTVETIGAFARAIAAKKSLPDNPVTTFNPRDGMLELRWSGGDVREVKFWRINDLKTDFRPRTWQVVARFDGSAKPQQRLNPYVDLEPGYRAAVFAEVRYATGGREYSLTSVPMLLPNRPR